MTTPSAVKLQNGKDPDTTSFGQKGRDHAPV